MAGLGREFRRIPDYSILRLSVLSDNELSLILQVLCLEPQIVAKMDELISGDCPTVNSEVDRLGFSPRLL